ncbi:SPFH domain-containing protein [Photobacterium leiognathi]|uniref:SPFH domain-containing protein n=1 Tax=Photobacterium leiognathi TaxID=553611 RepID=UPI0029826AD9|nr:SPFH domain-containing protein [Photobacterium leiognathi]
MIELSVVIAILFLLIICISMGVMTVPQNEEWLVERFGKYRTSLTAGLNFIVPFIDQVAAKQLLKEVAVDVPAQSAITQDNIAINVDGVLYFRILDAYKATYGVDNFKFAVVQLAQTTMRSELGQKELDKTFKERDQLNTSIVSAINEAAEPWGISVLRYELKDISPSSSVMTAMEAQMKAERMKRAQILESEGNRQAAINKADGEKQAQIMAAEGERQEQILRAEGEAQAMIALAEAKAESIEKVGEAASSEQGKAAIQLDLATLAIEAKKAIAKDSTVVLASEASLEPSTVVTQAMAVMGAVSKTQNNEQDA